MERPAVLTGEKVYLARHRREDADVITPHMSNLGLTTLLRGYGVTFSLEEEHKWLEHAVLNHDQQVIFAILTLEHRLVGGIDLRDIDFRMGTAALGVVLFNPGDWSQGYGSEAVKLLCQYGFYHLNLFNILLTVFSYNPRAIRAYQKVGFREMGRRRSCVPLGSERFDEVYMDITRDEVDLASLNMFSSGRVE